MGIITEQIRHERDAAEARHRARRAFTEQARARRAELNRQYRAEAKRRDVQHALDVIFAQQDARIARTLKASTDRILRARWGVTAEGDGLFAITKHGTTHVSEPVRRQYREQLP